MPEQTLKEAPVKLDELAFVEESPSVQKAASLFSSFRHAGRGLYYALNTQRNLRIQIALGVLVLIAGFLFQVSMLEMLLLWLAIVLVITCEIINTALELTLDIVSGGKFHALVKIIKDVIAAGVLLAAINAAVIGIIIFARHV